MIEYDNREVLDTIIFIDFAILSQYFILEIIINYVKYLLFV